MNTFMDRMDRLSYRSVFFLWAATVFGFALVYVVLSYSVGNGPTTLDEYSLGGRVVNAIYYSVITATNTGYGDIVPLGFSRVFAAIESFTGLFLFAFFMAKLVSRYQDVAIRQMHKMSLEATFHTVREDLHVVRRDFEYIMHIAERERKFTEYDWDRLRIAFKQVTNLLHEIPNFYDDTYHLYIIDAQREELLVEAFHRTLHRLNGLLTTLRDSGIDWISHEESAAELRQLLAAITKFIPTWRDKSAYKRPAHFEEVLHVAESIRVRMEQALPVRKKA